jgi:hypothetical protein
MLTVDLARPPSAKAYDELCSMRALCTIGDVAFYWLGEGKLNATRYLRLESAMTLKGYFGSFSRLAWSQNNTSGESP